MTFSEATGCLISDCLLNIMIYDVKPTNIICVRTCYLKTDLSFIVLVRAIIFMKRLTVKSQ